MLRAFPAQRWLWPCTVVEEVDRAPDDVPHYLPGKNPYMAEYRARKCTSTSRVSGAAPRRCCPSSAQGARPARRPTGPTRRNARPLRAPAAADVSRAMAIETARDNVYMLVGAGANTTVQVGTDGVLVVDTKLAGASARLLAAIDAIASAADPLRYQHSRRTRTRWAATSPSRPPVRRARAAW